MPTRLIAGSEHTDDRRRGEDIDYAAVRPRHAGIVTLGRPVQQCTAANGKSFAVHHDESAIGQGVDAASVPALCSLLQPLAVEHLIHLRNARTAAQVVRCAPMLGKIFRIPSPALKTRPVPGGERGRLVEKTQLGVESAPYVAMPSFECEHATDPMPRSPPPRW